MRTGRIVDCRIGSLEIDNAQGHFYRKVDCRIGSLEISAATAKQR